MVSISIIYTVILVLTSVSTLVLCAYYVLVFRKLNREEPETLQETSKPVSIVICARNERENLSLYLPKILEQDHPNFEVVLVNDASYDGTDEVLSELSIRYPHLEIVTVTHEQKRTPGKKMALTLGFKRAKHDIFLLTDADCEPLSDQWIHSMCDGMREGIVLGYSGYRKEKGLLNLLIRFDTWNTAVQYLSAALVGKAYMGVGRNMAYTRSHYHTNGGFRSHYHIMSGDDDLMVNRTANTENVRIRIVESAQTISVPKKQWGKWFSQKRRHMFVSKAYTPGSKRTLGLYHLAQLAFYAGLMLLVVLGIGWKWALSLYLIKTTIHLLISIPHTRVLKEKEMLVLLPILEPVMLSLNIVLGMWSRIRRPEVWK